MTTSTSIPATLRGILLLIASVTCFGAVDGLSKMLVAHVSFGQIMLARYILAFCAVLAATGPAQWRETFQTKSPLLQVLRGLTPIMVGGSMVFAVKYLPLAEATVILFAGPFFVVALSGWFLHERIPASSWIGVAIGFVAVLIVARPGFDALSVYAIYPLTAAIFYALLQLLSRRLGTAGERTVTTLSWTLMIGTLVALPLAAVDWVQPTGPEWFLLFALGSTFGAGQYLLARAFVLAPANTLTPFSYFQIVSAVLFGLVVFGDIPDGWTIAGIILIITAGLYVFARSKAQ
jgi:drug/metabolite transporter (DMT)-like permease